MEEGETRALVSEKAPSPSLATAPRQPNRVRHEQQLAELGEKVSRSVDSQHGNGSAVTLILIG